MSSRSASEPLCLSVNSLVSAQAASNWIMVFVLVRNSTNRGTTPHSMTLSIGGFFSFDSNLPGQTPSSQSRLAYFLNFMVASSWVAGLSLYIACNIAGS